MPVYRKLVYKGQKEISCAVGINWKNFTHYVREYDLPVFRIGGKGTWLALPCELEQWLFNQRDLYAGEKLPVIDVAKMREEKTLSTPQ